MDAIIIKNLEVFYHVGVTEEERAEAQRLLLTVEVEHDFRAAVAADDLGATIDYDALCRRLMTFGNDCHWSLIETLASDMAAMILEEYQVHRAQVEVRKFVIPQAKYVAVRVQRGPVGEGK